MSDYQGSSIKGILLLDYGGNTLTHLFSDELRLDPSLVGGFLSASNCFSNELFQTITKEQLFGNGFKLVFNHFYLKKFVSDYDLRGVPEGFDYDKLIVKVPNSINYFVADTVIFNGSEHDLEFTTFKQELNHLGTEPISVCFLDYSTKSPLYSVSYLPHVSWEVVNEGLPEERVDYAIIYDSIDDELPNDFMKKQFKALGDLLKQNSTLIGYAASKGYNSHLETIIGPKIKLFYDNYVKEREQLASNNPFYRVKRKISDDHSPVVDEIKSRLEKISKLINNNSFKEN